MIDALTSQYFNRAEFLGQLDRFYQAIEATAEEQRDFSEKQAFLNTVYERFFQGYSVKKADTHGIVYTPQPIVDFMCASVEEVLKTEFGKSLGDEWVHILDPATGTGNFIVNLLRRIPKHQLDDAYHHRLFANEVMLLPYYIASLNIEHEYYELTGKYAPFEGIALVDTLDLKEKPQMELGFFTEENAERIQRQEKAPINIIIGNPPYNVGQLNENDNNKNRVYRARKSDTNPGVDDRIQSTYALDSNATLNTKVYDMYVRFFRWATDRLQGREGIVCFVTNNSFIEQVAFDGMRKHLSQDFDVIYHFDLKGNARTTGERRRKEAGNIFEDAIRVGVGITLLIRAQRTPKKVYYHCVGDYLDSSQKRAYLESYKKIGDIQWQELKPDSQNTWLVPEYADEYSSNISLGDKETKGDITSNALFAMYGLGVSTNRDPYVFDCDVDELEDRITAFIEAYNAEVDRYNRNTNVNKHLEIDDFVSYDVVKWSSTLKRHLQTGTYVNYSSSEIRECLYRPFSRKYLYFNDILCDRRSQQPTFFPTTQTETENSVICVVNEAQIPFSTQISRYIPNLHYGGRQTQCFPFYIYDEDGSNRRENITDWALQQFRDEYDDQSITKWDIFYYVYGLLHHPGYRDRYADSLKRDLPRIPFAPDFRAFSEAGEQLAELHLNYEEAKPYPVEWVWKEDAQRDWRVEKMRLRKADKPEMELKVNEVLTLKGIPQRVQEYRLGNRSALEWVIDQYRIKTDKRSGITHDPNNFNGDERYIVDLVTKIITVSLATVDIVEGLPEFR